MKEAREGFTSSRQAEVCVCGHGRGEHFERECRGRWAGCQICTCICLRTSNARIVNAALFEEYCEHPAKFGGIPREI